MQSGAGIFTELIVSQDKSLGALIRTTQEVPRVLRTGAGSGGITSATQFGPGGLSGSFDPKSSVNIPAPDCMASIESRYPSLSF